jgi:hypothetical protein
VGRGCPTEAEAIGEKGVAVGGGGGHRGRWWGGGWRYHLVISNPFCLASYIKTTMDKVPSSFLCWGVQTGVVVVQSYLVSRNIWGLFRKNSSLSRGQSRGMLAPQVEWVKKLNHASPNHIVLKFYLLIWPFLENFKFYEGIIILYSHYSAFGGYFYLQFLLKSEAIIGFFAFGLWDLTYIQHTNT